VSPRPAAGGSTTGGSFPPANSAGAYAPPSEGRSGRPLALHGALMPTDLSPFINLRRGLLELWPTPVYCWSRQHAGVCTINPDPCNGLLYC
jgi:hypothetical protein